MMQKVGMQRKPSSARSSSATAWQPFLSAELSSCLGGSTFRDRKAESGTILRCHDRLENPVRAQNLS